MRMSHEIENALAQRKPVVALESTIISHGMPYPQNVSTALEVEETVKNTGALPATIGVVKGEIVVGLSHDEIISLARERDVMKLSTREIPLALALHSSGATTVSATSFIAEKAGISVFATGGIGGVHRGFPTMLDISRDLEELSERDLIVVCSGAKSILDLPKTLEYLETKGVLVLGYQTDELPAFYSRKSGLKIPRVDSVEEVAETYRFKKNYGVKGAILVTNPIPYEYEIPFEEEEKWVVEAEKKANAIGVKGKQLTPFLLSTLFELSNGRTLNSNIALIKANARLAALISVEITRKWNG